MPYDTQHYQDERASGARLPNGTKPLVKLTGKHLRLINYHLQGLKAGPICELLNVTPAWVSKVLNDPLTKAVLQERFVEIDNEMFVRSVQTVREKMDSEDEAISLRAADMVWRARGRYEKKADDRPTAEDVVQLMLRTAAQTGSASVTIRATAGEQGPLLEGKAA